MQKSLELSSEPQNLRSETANKAKVIRGNAMTLKEFQARYGLGEEEAKRLFDRFGPSAIELDLLMRAKSKAPVLPEPNGKSHA